MVMLHKEPVRKRNPTTETTTGLSAEVRRTEVFQQEEICSRL